MSKDLHNQLSMEVSKMRIELSIAQIENIKQVQATRNWINIFEKRFGASGVACQLREQLNDVIL